jgi:hypothetical protein
VCCILKIFGVNNLKNKQKDKMTLHLHFTLNISANLFGSLDIKLSAKKSFENLLEFGLWPPPLSSFPQQLTMHTIADEFPRSP